MVCLRSLVGTGVMLAGFLVGPSAQADLPIDEYPAASGTYTGSYSGYFTASVTQGDRGGGQLGGSVTYSYTFDVPTRPPLTEAQCQNNTPVTGPNDCNRSCVKKDSYKRYLSGPLTGIPAIGTSPSCSAPINSALQNIGLLEAYDACEAANAWGGETTTLIRVLVGALFHFNNPRTTQTTTGGLLHKETEWTYTNNAELLLPYVVIPAQVRITCMPKIARLNDGLERKDAGTIARPGKTVGRKQGLTDRTQNLHAPNSDPIPQTTPNPEKIPLTRTNGNGSVEVRKKPNRDANGGKPNKKKKWLRKKNEASDGALKTRAKAARKKYKKKYNRE